MPRNTVGGRINADAPPSLPENYQIPQQLIDTTNSPQGNVLKTSGVNSGDSSVLISAQMDSKKSGFFTKGKVLVLTVILLFVTLFSVPFALAYNNYELFSPGKNIERIIDAVVIKSPLPKNPRMIIVATKAEMAKVKSAKVEVEISFIVDGDFPIKDAKLNIKGPFDFKGVKQIRTEFEIHGEVGIEGLRLSLGGTLRQIDNVMYFKITEYPGGSFFQLDSIKNKWYFVDSSKKDPESHEEDKYKAAKEVIDEFIAQSYRNATFVESDDREVYSLKVGSFKEDIAKLVSDLVAVIDPKTQTKLEKNIEVVNIKKSLDKIREIELILKIDRNEFFIKESNLKIAVPVENNFGAVMPVGEITNPTVKESIANWNINFKLTDINLPFIIEIPEGAQDLNSYKDLLKTIPLDQQIFPQEGTGSGRLFENPQTLPGVGNESSGSIRDLIENQPPVLGEQDKFWDLLFLKFLFESINL